MAMPGQHILIISLIHISSCNSDSRAPGWHMQIQKERIKTFANFLKPDDHIWDELYGSGSNITFESARKGVSSSTAELALLYKKEGTLVTSLDKLRNVMARNLHLLKLNTISEMEKLRNSEGGLKEIQAASIRFYSVVDNVVDFLPNPDEFWAVGALGIVRIQEMYDDDMLEMAKGNVMGEPSLHSLGWNDCVHMSDTAKLIGRIDKKVEWVRTALKMAKLDNSTSIRQVR